MSKGIAAATAPESGFCGATNAGGIDELVDGGG